jgi:hypothetical protein
METVNNMPHILNDNRFGNLTDNQIKFVTDAEKQGYEVNFSYSGRGMFGRECPSIVVDTIEDFVSATKFRKDNMGMGYVLYAQN